MGEGRRPIGFVYQFVCRGLDVQFASGNWDSWIQLQTLQIMQVKMWLVSLLLYLVDLVIISEMQCCLIKYLNF